MPKILIYLMLFRDQQQHSAWFVIRIWSNNKKSLSLRIFCSRPKLFVPVLLCEPGLVTRNKHKAEPLNQIYLLMTSRYIWEDNFMNISTEKENLFTLSGEPSALSPYLSPFLACSNSNNDLHDEELIKFTLDEPDHLEPTLDEPHLQDPSLEVQMMAEPLPVLDELLVKVLEHEATSERKPIYSAPRKDSSKINCIINFLIDNNEMGEEQLMKQGLVLYEGSNELKYIFSVMIGKFKKLKKTKQQMTKFCMRKAFKFVSDFNSESKKRRKSAQEGSESQDKMGIEMPFRKNSTEKTMNAQFLKQVFSRGNFAQVYQKFLQDFRRIIIEDNQYKIKYLSQTIEQHIASGNLKKIQEIKRLPWTSTILTKTENLAFSLMKFAGQADSDSEKY